jgi:hypothetical protein
MGMLIIMMAASQQKQSKEEGRHKKRMNFSTTIPYQENSLIKNIKKIMLR